MTWAYLQALKRIHERSEAEMCEKRTATEARDNRVWGSARVSRSDRAAVLTRHRSKLAEVICVFVLAGRFRH